MKGLNNSERLCHLDFKNIQPPASEAGLKKKVLVEKNRLTGLKLFKWFHFL